MINLRTQIAPFLAGAAAILLVSLVLVIAAGVREDGEDAVAGAPTVTPAVLEDGTTPGP